MYKGKLVDDIYYDDYVIYCKDIESTKQLSLKYFVSKIFSAL